ncbi:MAG: FkbM family methyltransferase [Minisyncoccia bacterium]
MTTWTLVRALLSHVFKKRWFVSYAQFGEDAILNTIFRKKSSGFYVDVGAYHPTHYSNTYALYRRGWHGIVIDPNSTFKPLFSILRPRDTFVAAAVGEGAARYYEYNNPLYNSLNQDVSNDRIHLARTKDIQLKPLRDIVNTPTIDLLSIDAEGYDLAVLETLDWATRPGIIVIEGDESSGYLQGKGYSLIAITGPSRIWRDAA